MVEPGVARSSATVRSFAVDTMAVADACVQFNVPALVLLSDAVAFGGACVPASSRAMKEPPELA